MESCGAAMRLLAVIPLLVLASCGSGGESPGSNNPAQSLTVYAASSLQPAFDKIAAKLKSQNIATTFNYAGTQTLTTQLQQGAQADVFASADTAHMTTLNDAGLLAGDPKVFVHNRLEIVVERGNPKGIHSLADLARSGLVVVLADPSVPAGKYAQQALAKAGVTVHPKSLEQQVTAVLSKVALGEADAGIVYHSDLVTSNKVEGVEIPDNQNVVADYSIGKLFLTQHGDAADAFIAYVLSPAGQTILKAAGFTGV
jgi:molybdate transport system substrate-binding protein